MKFSFAIAALMAVVTIDSAAAINLSAEPSKEPSAGPVVKKEEPKKDEAVVKAKFEAVKAKKEAADEVAKETELKDSAAAEEETQRKKDAYQTAYWGHVKDQADETKRIKELRVRPSESKPMTGHEAGTETSKGEHWTASMPDHILDNTKGPTAPFDSKAPEAPKDAADSSNDEKKTDDKKKADAAAIGAKSADAAAAGAKADPKEAAPAQVAKEWKVQFWAVSSK